MPPSKSAATPDRETEITSSEAGRLEALRRYQIFDSEAEPAFDELTMLAARLCETPIALITFVDEERDWFKSKLGLSIGEIPREYSFSEHTIKQGKVFTVDEARRSKKFSANPLVASEPHIAFYAGAPLLTKDNHAIGTICVMDLVSRDLTSRQLELLQLLGRQVMTQLELRLEKLELQRAFKTQGRKQSTNHRKEKLLTAILEALPVGVSYTNHNGELQLTNPAHDALWAGTNKPAVKELGKFKLWVAELQRLFTKENWGVARAIAHGTVTLQEMKEVECWDGTHKTVLHSAVPLSDAEHGIDGAIAVNEDITTLKRMEDILRETRTWFRQVVENINEVFWMTNLDKSQFLYVSPAFEKIWGHPCKYLYDHPDLWIESVHPGDQERAAAAVENFLESGDELKEEFRIVKPNGAVRWIRNQTFQVKGKDGEAMRLVGIATDITEQKEAEEILQQSENEFRMMFEHAPFGIALVDPEGYPMKSNPTFQRLLGYSEEELRGMSFSEFTHPEDVEKDRKLYEELVEGKRENYQVEKRYIRKDEELVFVRLTVSLDRTPGEDLCAVAMIEDITDQVDMEQFEEVTEEADQEPLEDATEEKNLEPAEESAEETDQEQFEEVAEEENLDQFDAFTKKTTLAPSEEVTEEENLDQFESFTKKPNLNQFEEVTENTDPEPLQETESATEVHSALGQGELVLVVDDDHAVVALTKQMLETCGYKVLTADNGMDAIGICASYSDTLQVVLTDVSMPGMDGTDLVYNLLEINPDLRIIVFSGDCDEELQSRAFESGAKAFLSKPFTMQSLLDSIMGLVSEQ